MKKLLTSFNYDKKFRLNDIKRIKNNIKIIYINIYIRLRGVKNNIRSN